MKRLLVSVTMLAALTGCAGDVAFVEAADRYHKTVGVDYTTYVAADATTDAFQKKIRLDAHRRFGEAIEARRKLGGR